MWGKTTAKCSRELVLERLKTCYCDLSFRPPNGDVYTVSCILCCIEELLMFFNIEKHLCILIDQEKLVGLRHSTVQGGRWQGGAKAAVQFRLERVSS